MKLRDFFPIISIVCSISSQVASDVFPNFYHVSFTSTDSNFQKLEGYYKKKDWIRNDKPVFKKPRVNDYLSLKN